MGESVLSRIGARLDVSAATPVGDRILLEGDEVRALLDGITAATRALRDAEVCQAGMSGVCPVCAAMPEEYAPNRGHYPDCSFAHGLLAVNKLDQETA